MHPLLSEVTKKWERRQIFTRSYLKKKKKTINKNKKKRRELSVRHRNHFTLFSSNVKELIAISCAWLSCLLVWRGEASSVTLAARMQSSARRQLLQEGFFWSQLCASKPRLREECHSAGCAAEKFAPYKLTQRCTAIPIWKNSEFDHLFPTKVSKSWENTLCFHYLASHRIWSALQKWGKKPGSSPDYTTCALADLHRGRANNNRETSMACTGQSRALWCCCAAAPCRAPGRTHQPPNLCMQFHLHSSELLCFFHLSNKMLLEGNSVVLLKAIKKKWLLQNRYISLSSNHRVIIKNNKILLLFILFISVGHSFAIWKTDAHLQEAENDCLLKWFLGCLQHYLYKHKQSLFGR